MEKTGIAAAFQGCGYSRMITEKQIKKATVNRTIPTAVVDSGASSTCVKPAEEEAQESVCGGYKWIGPLYLPTGKKPNKIFAMALGHTAPGGDVVDLPLPLRTEAREGHTVKGIKNNLYSINRLVKEGYIPIFTNDGFMVYDATNKQKSVARRSAQGLLLPRRGPVAHPTVAQGWRIHKNSIILPVAAGNHTRRPTSGKKTHQ